MTPTQTPTNASPLAWRRPAWLFGALFLVSATAIATIWAALAANGFGAVFIEALPALAAPAALGGLILALTLSPRIARGRVQARWQVIAQAASAFGICGFVWPLSLGLQLLTMGQVDMALSNVAPALLGALIGSIGGAFGGAACLFCFARRESVERQK